MWPISQTGSTYIDVSYKHRRVCTVHLFTVVFHVCSPYLTAKFGLVPGVKSMTELGAALLVLSRGEGGIFKMSDNKNTHFKLTSTMLRENKLFHNVPIYLSVYLIIYY